MFTGLIEEVGEITALRPQTEAVELEVRCSDTLKGVALGDSIAVDGICLTVTGFTPTHFTTFASAETLRCTNLLHKKVGDRVNLERPLSLDKKLGGHMVQGHVDGVGAVSAIRPEGDSQMWYFSVSPDLAKYLVSKGSVAVDGISLTVVAVDRDAFTVAIIPKTLAATTFQFRKAGDPVNIEVDIIGKYVYRFMHPDETTTPIESPMPELDALQSRGRA